MSTMYGEVYTTMTEKYPTNEILPWDMSFHSDNSQLEDHDIYRKGWYLKGKRIAVMVGGGIAAYKTPDLVRKLYQYGAHEVYVYLTPTALGFVSIKALKWNSATVVTELTEFSEHLEQFSACLVVPATYNTINKFANGIADNAVTTTLAAAFGLRTPIIMAPAMHGDMYNHIVAANCAKLAAMGVHFLTPRQQNNKLNVPSAMDMVTAVCRATSNSPLKRVPILVTGGPTPVPIDGVRRITNRFRGRLGIRIAEELYMRGADAHLIHGDGALRPPKHIPWTIARTYADYLRLVQERAREEFQRGINAGRKMYHFGIFSAGVADFRPETATEGKIPSGSDLNLKLVSTHKVIDIVRQQRPDMHMVTFKYQEGISHKELMTIAHNRIQKPHEVVIANRGEEVGPNGEQVAWMVSKTGETKLIGKNAIAIAIVDYLETLSHLKQIPLEIIEP